MYDFINPMLQWINLHPQLAGLATFFISAAESIAIIGTIVPGTVMMTAVGTLAGAAVMPLWSTIIWAILGAIVGDGISYWMGYYFKFRLSAMWPFRTHTYLLASGEKFFKKHGGKSVFIGRFVGPVRALVPLVAGMLGMRPLHFSIANVASAICWAPAYMLPGIALGAASLELPPDIAVHAILMLLLVGLFIIFCLWFIQKLFALIGTQINQSLLRLWHRLHISRYFKLFTTAFKHHDIHKTYGQLTLAFYCLITSMCFLYLAAYVYLHGSQDIAVNNFFFHLFRSLRTPTADTVFLVITQFGETKVIFPIIAAVFLWLAWTRRWRVALHVLALTILTSVGIEVFKHAVHSARPWGIAHSPPSWSYPSGHSAFAMALFSGFALLLTRKSNRIIRKVTYIMTGICVAAVCISRMYLGVHWFTDVVGGVLLGASVLMLVILSYNRKIELSIKPFGFICTLFLATLLSFSANFYAHYTHYKKDYAQIDWPIYTINMNSWWKQEGKNLPFYRVNRFGISSQILNLQWLGDLSNIEASLLKNGWEIPPQTDWITILHRISDVQSAEHLPIVPALHLDKRPVIVLIKHSNNNKKLIVLRLWNSNVIIQNVNKPLWVGTVDIAPRTYSWLFRPKHQNEITLTATNLFTQIPLDYDIEEKHVVNVHRHHPEQQTIVLIKPKNL